MGKLLIKKISTSVNTSIDCSTNSPLPSSSQTCFLCNKIKSFDTITVKRRKYKENYLNFGFRFTGDENNQIP